MSIRFKYGIHTIFIFVDPTKPFSSIAEELLGILKERYPAGLSATLEGREMTELPNDASQIKFAVPKDPRDLSQDWKALDIGEQDTPADKNIKNNDVVAFAFAPQDADESYQPNFEVYQPPFDDYDEQ